MDAHTDKVLDISVVNVKDVKNSQGNWEIRVVFTLIWGYISEWS